MAVASRPHGGAQCGTISPASASRAASLLAGCGGDLVGDRRDLGADRLRLRREVEGEVTALAGERVVGGGGAPPSTTAEELAQGHRAPQVEVGVVLPGEPDPAEHLDAVLGDAGEGVEGDGARRHHREVAAVGVRVVEGEGGVPRHGAGLLEGDEHVGAAVLHALELADRPTELLPILGVGGRGVDAPRRRAGRLRGGEGDPQLLDGGAVEGRELVAGRDHHAIERHLGDAPGRVQRLDGGHLDVVAGDHAPALPVPDASGHQEKVGDRRAQHRRDGAAEHERTVVAGGGVDRAGPARPCRPPRRAPAARAAPWDPRPHGWPRSPTTDGRNGPGASARPSSSTTTASSAIPVALASDRLGQVEARSTRARPARPRTGASASSSRSTAARTTAGGMRSAVKRRAVSRSASWSSPMAMLTCPSPWLRS